MSAPCSLLAWLSSTRKMVRVQPGGMVALSADSRVFFMSVKLFL